jgi:hypothetical protein
MVTHQSGVSSCLEQLLVVSGSSIGVLGAFEAS